MKLMPCARFAIKPSRMQPNPGNWWTRFLKAPTGYPNGFRRVDSPLVSYALTLIKAFISVVSTKTTSEKTAAAANLRPVDNSGRARIHPQTHIVSDKEPILKDDIAEIAPVSSSKSTLRTTLADSRRISQKGRAR